MAKKHNGEEKRKSLPGLLRHLPDLETGNLEAAFLLQTSCRTYVPGKTDQKKDSAKGRAPRTHSNRPKPNLQLQSQLPRLLLPKPSSNGPA